MDKTTNIISILMCLLYIPVFEDPVINSRTLICTIAHHKHGMIEVALTTCSITVYSTGVILELNAGRINSDTGHTIIQRSCSMYRQTILFTPYWSNVIDSIQQSIFTAWRQNGEWGASDGTGAVLISTVVHLQAKHTLYKVKNKHASLHIPGMDRQILCRFHQSD